MVAVAPGKVVDVGRIKVRAGGNKVKIAHTGYKNSVHPAYLSFYAHLGEIFVGMEWSKKAGRKRGYVRRGEPIGTIPSKFRNIAKLIFYEHGNLVDPDKYGPGHSYMEYFDFSYDDFNVTDERVPSIHGKLSLQRGIVNSFDRHRIGWRENDLIFNMHKKGGYGANRFSTVENFRLFCIIFLQ